MPAAAPAKLPLSRLPLVLSRPCRRVGDTSAACRWPERCWRSFRILSVTEVPTLGEVGLALLFVLISAPALWLLKRTR